MTPDPEAKSDSMTWGRAAVHMIVPGAISEESALAAVTPEERIRASRFHFAADAARWISYRARLREILGAIIGLPPSKVPLVRSVQGKPLLAAPFDALHFNLSHCPELALLVVCCNGPVGIDLESNQRASQQNGCEANFCHPAEIARLPADPEKRSTELLAIWTAKEAVLKALGTGLIHPPEALQVRMIGRDGSATSTPQLEGIASQRIHVLRHPDLEAYRAVVSTPSSVAIIEFI